ncbi:glucosylceramidase [Mucilaginibacter corticis]|uniref:Glucosylceramidase n=1 Tax=Mucilaginibacter corticis TaxID=2597670 RepID=A0A556M7X3_9SPHI|nr:glycoside hydrolase family 30 beta sandwich domain-containing protein [Mucilaginibacter corticis]TSJ35935.1 glucosylceramidase [Mucilaginibacter corticis]
MKFLTVLFTAILLNTACCAQNTISWWLTNNEKSALLSKQSPLAFGTGVDEKLPVITVDPAKKYQQVDGFGFALTGGSAQNMIRMSAGERHKIIRELFGNGPNDVGISYLRLSIGSSDLNDHTFSYDDVPAGQTDLKLEKFTLKEDERDVIPVLKEILAVNPAIKILGSPWSPPLWMKSNHNIQGGRLQDQYYDVYARYFVKYVQEMAKHGIRIDAVTIQNEPFNDGNTPSNQFLAKEELNFIKNNLGPLFKANGIKTKIILYDHNCDAPEYPISIMTDPMANQYVDGSGFHLYAGPVTALSKVHDAFPDKNLYFTEMMAVSHSDFNVANPEERIVIGATRNWSRNVILWNIAADPQNKPHTDNGGCAGCQGAITIDGDKVSRNLAYYTIGQVSKFVPAGSVRIESSLPDGLSDVAFATPDGKTVLVVANKGNSAQTFKIAYKNKAVIAHLSAASVATYVW